MRIPRRRFLYQVAGAAALPAVTRIAGAQAYPTRPVRITVAGTAKPLYLLLLSSHTIMGVACRVHNGALGGRQLGPPSARVAA
jgi:hypothetical protein